MTVQNYSNRYLLFFLVIILISLPLSHAVPQAEKPPKNATANPEPKQQSEVDTATELVDPNPKSPSPAAEEKTQDNMVLPSSLVNPPSGKLKHHRNLKSLMRRKKPTYEDFLDNSQKRVLETAVKKFGLFYNIFPVKRDSGLDADSSPDNEADQIKAFELLCTIVGRSVRDAVACSSSREDSIARKEIKCDKTDEITIFFSQDVDDGSDILCSPNDPENAFSEECKKKSEGVGKKTSMKVTRGPALDVAITAYNTARPGASIRLPPNGRLRDALDRQLWKAASPTKIIITLAPFEFLKGGRFLEKLNHQMVAAFTKKYGSTEIYNIATVEFPEIFSKRLSITQLALRYIATAEKLARIILRWHRKVQVQLDQIHFIGTSLGAHLAGVVAKLIREKAEGVSVARVTGLDPLGWGFDEIDGIGVDTDLELSKDDAAFVDVIHTSSPDPNFPYIHYGSNEKRGQADFYPNNGRAQYCGKTDGLCHHFYSVILYTASISGANFNGCKCSSWDDFIIERKCSPCMETARMGEHVDTGKANGVYYLATA